MKKIKTQGLQISIFSQNEGDYISLTDIARYKNADEPKDVVKNWMRNRNTIEFLGFWEKINNPEFKGVEFDPFRMAAGLNSFVLSPQKWINKTSAIGIISKAGNNGGTFAHKDIAFEFASWISPEFKLYLIKEFQRLKDSENKMFKLEWNLQRTLSKINYRIHTDAIKENIIPELLSKEQINLVYSNEADLLNMALFGETAASWRSKNPNLSGNIRNYSSLEQLVILSNLESINAVLITKGIAKSARLEELNKTAILQMRSLLKNENSIKKLENS